MVLGGSCTLSVREKMEEEKQERDTDRNEQNRKVMRERESESEPVMGKMKQSQYLCIHTCTVCVSICWYGVGLCMYCKMCWMSLHVLRQYAGVHLVIMC